MYEHDFQESVRKGIEARRRAREVLGVSPDSDAADIKAAWRRLCKKYHPDRSPEDEDARRKFALATCAYRLLAHGEPCNMLAEGNEGLEPDDETEHTSWGYFLWWRDAYFG